MSRPQGLSRRDLFGFAAGSVLTAQMPVHVAPAMMLDRASSHGLDDAPGESGPALQVAGPRDGELAAWARRLQGPLADGLMQGGRLDLRYGGGVDGVTGANQFDARVTPDGQVALLFPGSVALAWLVGEGRVRLDPAHLLPLLAAYGPGVLMVRDGISIGPDGTVAGATPSKPLRLAVGPAPDASLTALLGLDLLEVPVVAVAGGPNPAEAARGGAADAVFLHGVQAASHAPGLVQAGFKPALSAMPDDVGPPALLAPGFLAGLPQRRLRQDPMVEAWQAVAAASTLCAVLVVPRLTPAAAIGLWRHAASAGVADEALQAQARSHGIALADGAGARDALAPMQVSGDTQLALRRWLSERLGWQPG